MEFRYPTYSEDHAVAVVADNQQIHDTEELTTIKNKLKMEGSNDSIFPEIATPLIVRDLIDVECIVPSIKIDELDIPIEGIFGNYIYIHPLLYFLTFFDVFFCRLFFCRFFCRFF